MKKITLLIATLLLASIAATAQTSSRWGITAGVNYNEVHFKQTDIMPAKRMWGPQVGVTGEMNFGGIGFGVEGGLLYSLKQGKLNYGDRTAWSSMGYGNETVSMHYIDVPLHLKFKYRRLNGLEDTFKPMVYVDRSSRSSPTPATRNSTPTRLSTCISTWVPDLSSSIAGSCAPATTSR